jgi:polyphosphate glucokinase
MPTARRPRHEVALGIDIGGTGVKAALVDVATGELRSARVRRKTPHPSTPEAVALTTREVIDAINEEVPLPEAVPVGAGLPGVIKNGQLTTAANLDQGWLKVSAGDVLGEAIGRKVVLINDADAAGLAEMRFGAGKGHAGTVLLLTIGTGIGSAIFIDGRLLDSTEFGHFRFHGTDAEKRLSGASRERRKLRWKTWADEFNDYLAQLEFVLNPDLIILGGGVSKEMAKFGEFLKSKAPLVPAKYLNTSGIVGAAMYAAEVS